MSFNNLHPPVCFLPKHAQFLFMVDGVEGGVSSKPVDIMCPDGDVMYCG